MHPNLPFFCRAVAYDKGMNKRKFTTLFVVVFRCLLATLHDMADMADDYL